MAQDAISGDVVQLALLAPEDQESIDQIIDEVLMEEQPIAQISLIEEKLHALDLQTTGTAFETIKFVLQSLWYFSSALRLIQTEADYTGALDFLKSATDRFNQVGLSKIRDMSIGVSAYATAIVNVQSRNMGRAEELFKEAKEYLQKAGEFGNIYQPMIDAMRPEALFVTGVKALQEADFATGETLMNQAAQAAEQFASNYSEEGEPIYNLFRGMASLYRAYYTFNLAWNQFNRFEYDKLAAEKDLARNAVQASQLLDQIDPGFLAGRNLYRMSKCIAQLLEYLPELSKLMIKVFHSTFKTDLQTLQRLRQNIQSAKDSVNEAGPLVVGLVRFCDQLSNQIDNLEKLAKPSKKDFGVFSGLVSCALFVPIFLIEAWANTMFGIKLEPTVLITSCLIIALIGGFGFGALKFKSLILPGSSWLRRGSGNPS